MAKISDMVKELCAGRKDGLAYGAFMLRLSMLAVVYDALH